MVEEQLPRAIGQYEVTGRIGKGAMGQVFKAIQPSLNRVVAIKVLPLEMGKDPERVERFNREAQAVAMLNHPNVVQIIDKDQDGDLLFFVMEYVPGSSLDAVLRQRRLSLPETLKVFRGVCRGLNAAHHENITHRDLNPRNILVSEDLSTVKLADFGISRVESISLIEGTLSTSQLSLGSLHYMAPEQARDMGAVDQRSDIYSAGVVLYEMLTGRLPVGRFSLPSQLNSEVPPDLDPIVLKCLATSPVDRYPSVAQLLADVGRLEDQLRLGLADELRGISRTTTRMFTRSTRSVARNRGLQLALIGAVVLVIAAAGAFFVLRDRAGAPAPPTSEAAEVPGAEAPAGEAASPGGAGGAETTAGEAPGTEGTAAVPATEAGATAPGAGEPAANSAAAKPAAGKTAGPSTAVKPAPAPPPPPPPAHPAAPAVDPAIRELEVARDQFAAKLTDPALATLEGLISDNPKSPVVPDAYLLTAEIKHATHQDEEAMATYVEVRTRFPKDPRAAEAGFRLGQLQAASGDRGHQDAARQAYREVASEFPQSAWAIRALVAEADLEQDKGLYQRDDRLATSVPAALVTLRQLVELAPDAPETEKAFWDLGEIYEKIKRYDLAAQAFTDLGTRFRQTRYDAWWRAGQLYDKRLDQDAKAVEAYQRVPDKSPHSDEAKKRISKLTR
jgi:TolA-binding protein/predicted Ser/Thr protein kinase